MKVGNLVHHRRESPPDDLPVGMIVEIEPTVRTHAWCEVLWDDGTQSGLWLDELMLMEHNESR